MTEFANPEMFLLLPLVAWVFYKSAQSTGRIRYSNIERLKALKATAKWHPRMLLKVLRLLALLLFVVALARPRLGKTLTDSISSGVPMLLAVDTSGSMQALDFMLEGQRVSRLEVVKKVVADFIDKRPTDPLGLVVFGAEAFIQCPLTLDHGILVDFLKQIELGMAGDATAIGSALGVAVNRIKDMQAKSKVIILLTDGRSNTGRIPPLKAAEIAKTFGIKVYTIGAGTQGKAPFLVNSIFGQRYVYHDVDIDEKVLKEISDITGGKYFRATDTDSLAHIYDEIDQLEKTEIKVKHYTEYNEVFHWALIPGLILLLIELLLSQTRLRKIP